MRFGRYAGALLLAGGIFLAGGCAEAEPLVSGEHPPVRLAAWQSYWDAPSGAQEYEKVKKKLTALSCFAVYYDASDAFLVPDEVRDMAKQRLARGTARYLTFTNDIGGANKKEKDIAILRRLLKDDDARVEQAEKMAALAKELKMDGVELDFEGFVKDADLRAAYLSFTYQLIRVCANERLKLRIVLEPSFPFGEALAKGPEYVVMFYNLYGRHSGPGPKADRAFIEKTIGKMEAIPGDKAAAFATGGCLWEDYGLLGLKSGTRRFVTEAEAVQLAKKHKVSPARDESGAMHYTFKDGKHETEVWYADVETLNAWITLAANHGIEAVNIWRLGSNDKIEGIER